MPPQKHGEIITFYSYKGGTGRSMALANVACLLAKRKEVAGRGVLMIDWDLEAPGLHRYFQNFLLDIYGGTEESVDLKRGLLDLFAELDRKLPPGEDDAPDGEAVQHARRVLADTPFEDYVLRTGIPNLYLLKAGRFDDEYSNLVNRFDWESLYRRSTRLFSLLAEEMAKTYAYVLIDSRTGITDTSGICTMLMPEKLVVVFTPNRQSITGITNLVEKATEYRKRSEDLRPLTVFPLPSRIETQLEKAEKDWRLGNDALRIKGYKPLFEELFRRIYDLDEEECDLGDYFSDVVINQSPDYAFGEEIAVNVEGGRPARLSLGRSYETFMQRLVETDWPWESPEDESAQTDSAADGAESAVALAESAFNRLPPDEQVAARRVFLRLVRLALPGEGDDTAKRAALSEFPHEAQPVVGKLAKAGVLKRVDEGADTPHAVEFAHAALPNSWERLKRWAEAERHFLRWRQKLAVKQVEWEDAGRARAFLLGGEALREARTWLEESEENLNDREIFFIRISASEEKVRRRKLVFVGMAVAVLLMLIGGAYAWQQRIIRQQQEQLAYSKAVVLTAEGNDKFENGDTSGALAKYSEAITVKDDYDKAYLNAGIAYQSLNQTEQAMRSYEKALALTTDAEMRAQTERRINLLKAMPASDRQPSVYIEIPPSVLEDEAKYAASVLKREGFVTMSTTVSGKAPDYTTVNYYHTVDEPEAERIVGILRGMGVPDARAFHAPRSYDSVKPRHYEIWFSQKAFQANTTNTAK